MGKSVFCLLLKGRNVSGPEASLGPGS